MIEPCTVVSELPRPCNETPRYWKCWNHRVFGKDGKKEAERAVEMAQLF